MLFLDKSPKLTDVEHQLYLYIENHLTEVIYMRIRELAYATHTSTATIQRFCHKFNCDGFSEFKIRLKIYLNSNNQLTEFKSANNSIIDFFNRTQKTSFDELLSQAANLLINKDLIIFIGVGSSDISAQYGALYFTSLFQIAVKINDPLTDPFFYISKDLVNKSAIIAISVSGETDIILNYLRDSKLRNATTISITNSANNSVAKSSTLNIPYFILKENIGIQDITSQAPTIYILEQLAKKVHNLKFIPKQKPAN